jgi:hypothetical protein
MHAILNFMAGLFAVPVAGTFPLVPVGNLHGPDLMKRWALEMNRDPKKRRKVMIVIEEIGPGDEFNVYMEGDIDRLKDKTFPDDKLSTAEFWGSRLFSICVNAINSAGALKTIKPMPGGN